MILNHKSDCTILFATQNMYRVVGEVFLNRMSQYLQKIFLVDSDRIRTSPSPTPGGWGGDSRTVLWLAS